MLSSWNLLILIMLSSKAELCGSVGLTQRLAEMDGRVCARRPHPLQSFVALVSGRGGARTGRGRGFNTLATSRRPRPPGDWMPPLTATIYGPAGAFPPI